MIFCLKEESISKYDIDRFVFIKPQQLLWTEKQQNHKLIIKVKKLN